MIQNHKAQTYVLCRTPIHTTAKTKEKPNEKRIVFVKTIDLFLSISPKSFPVIYEMYPGIIGSTHGVRKLMNPAPKANASLMIIVTLYLPFNFTANTILAHDI